MVTRDLGRRKWSWKVVDESISDHRSIDVEEEVREDRVMVNDMKKGQWNWRSADWVKMNSDEKTSG